MGVEFIYAIRFKSLQRRTCLHIPVSLRSATDGAIFRAASGIDRHPRHQTCLKLTATDRCGARGWRALGLAHIGVLKWFEEHHIPIDFLAETSMGGLVGGLYSTGKSANDLQEVVKSANWPLLLGGGTPYEDLAFRRKEDARQVPNVLLFGLKGGSIFRRD